MPYNTFLLQLFLQGSKSRLVEECESPAEAKRRQRQLLAFRREYRTCKPPSEEQAKINNVTVRAKGKNLILVPKFKAL